MAVNNEILDIIKNETDIVKLKELLILLDDTRTNVLKELSVYQFYLNMLDLSVDFEYFEKPLVSIVIPVKNEFFMTQFLLNSIYSYTQGIPYEVIIADDNSDDKTKDIETLYQNVKVVKNDISTPGFLYNVKNAIKQARGEYILLLNNDMLVFENYLTEMLNVIQKYNDIGIVGAKTLTLGKKITECGVKVKKNGEIIYIGLDELPNFLDNEEYIDCDYCSGCSILFKKETWDKAGGFDENLAPAYYEDSDFAFNVKYNLGLKSVCVPRAKLYHFCGITYNKFSIDKVKIAEKNKTYFLNKWGKYIEN